MPADADAWPLGDLSESMQHDSLIEPPATKLRFPPETQLRREGKYNTEICLDKGVIAGQPSERQKFFSVF